MVLDLLWGLNGTWTFDNEVSSYHVAWDAHHELGVFGLPSHKVEHIQQQSIIKRKWCIYDWIWASPGRHKQVTWRRNLNAYCFDYCNAICCQACTCGLMECILWWLRKRRLGPVLLGPVHAINAPPRSVRLQCCGPFLRQLWRTLAKANLQSGWCFRECIWACIIFGRRNRQMCNCLLVHGL